MPNDKTVWIILVVAVAAVTSLALWLGRHFEVSWSPFKVTVRGAIEPKKLNINVAEGIEVERSRVGDIAGLKTSSSGVTDLNADITAARNAKIRNASVGDIVGIKENKVKSPEDKEQTR